MTSTLALPSILPGELHEQGMAIPPDLTFEAWEAALRNAEWIERASPWWVVDLVAFGRAKFDEEYTQALPDAIEDADGFHQAKLRQAEWMADRWPPSTRVPEQSYSAHRTVAKLNRDDAVALLEMTDADGRRLTVRELIKRVDGVEQAILGKAVTSSGAPVVPSDDLVWHPTRADLVAGVLEALELRLAGMSKRNAVGFEAGALWAWMYAEALDCFKQDEPARRPAHPGGGEE